jgi:hypothetical protein
MAFEISQNFYLTIIRERGGIRVCPDISREIENSVSVCIRWQVFDVRFNQVFDVRFNQVFGVRFNHRYNQQS